MKFIAYYRVSTVKQGNSGLSLEWQREQAISHVKQQAGELIAEFSEVETGTGKRQRTEIYKAMNQAEQEGATLIVAKLDRLSRDVTFIDGLLKSKVKFICLDMPGADQTTIGILSVIAQQESQRIRERTQNAIAMRRKRGDKMGFTPALDQHRQKGIANSLIIRKELARTKNEKAVQLICALRKDAKYSFNKIAEHLNTQAIKTTRGNKFTPKQVQLLFLRYC